MFNIFKKKTNKPENMDICEDLRNREAKYKKLDDYDLKDSIF